MPHFLFAPIIYLSFFSDISVSEDSYSGYAYDLDSTEHYYTETFRDVYKDSAHVISYTDYYDDEKKVFSKRVLDFSKYRYTPTFSREDFRNGYKEGAQIVGSEVYVYKREDTESVLEEKKMTVPAPFIIDGGFNNYIKDNWTVLTNGESLSFKFIVPAYLDYFSFRARMESELKFHGKDAVKFVIESDHYLIRLLTDPIEVIYNTDDKRILCYRGRSNIYNTKGKNYEVLLVYPEKGP